MKAFPWVGLSTSKYRARVGHAACATFHVVRAGPSPSALSAVEGFRPQQRRRRLQATPTRSVKMALAVVTRSRVCGLLRAAGPVRLLAGGRVRRVLAERSTG